MSYYHDLPSVTITLARRAYKTSSSTAMHVLMSKGDGTSATSSGGLLSEENEAVAMDAKGKEDGVGGGGLGGGDDPSGSGGGSGGLGDEMGDLGDEMGDTAGSEDSGGGTPDYGETQPSE